MPIGVVEQIVRSKLLPQFLYCLAIYSIVMARKMCYNIRGYILLISVCGWRNRVSIPAAAFVGKTDITLAAAA